MKYWTIVNFNVNERGILNYVDLNRKRDAFEQDADEDVTIYRDGDIDMNVFCRQPEFKELTKFRKKMIKGMTGAEVTSG